MKKTQLIVPMLMTAALSLTACNSAGGGDTYGRTASAVGPGCSGGNGSVCLGIRYISYDEGKGPISSKEQAASDLEGINRIWAQCGIQFEIDSYEAVNPTSYGLASGSDAQNQLDAIRNAFNDGHSLLVVYTGYWGSTKNAWTSMPGSAPYGAVLESSVVNYPNIVAHELGHYLGLDHVDDTANVMNALIYSDSKALDSGQCDLARQTVQQSWSTAQR